MPNLCEKYEFTILPRHYHNTHVFTEMPRHLRKCQNYDITANIWTPLQTCILFFFNLFQNTYSKSDFAPNATMPSNDGKVQYFHDLLIIAIILNNQNAHNHRTLLLSFSTWIVWYSMTASISTCRIHESICRRDRDRFFVPMSIFVRDRDRFRDWKFLSV
jgi:hypothetical protein